MTLDVTDVLDDPDFKVQLVRIRTVESINEHGRAVFEPVETPFWGVVTQMGASAVTHRDTDATFVSDSIAVTTTTELIGSNQTANADIVVYQGKQYTVMNVRDNSNWGAGFYRADCSAIPYN